MSPRALQRVLVSGAAGMLGSQLLRSAPAGVEALGTDLASGDGVAAPGVDLAERGALEQVWEELGPFDGVIHAAAWTAVDLAEEREADARRANVDASRALAALARERGARLVAIGTDFVFDGEKRSPYTEDDPPNPLGAYGRTKLEGERALLAAHPEAAVVRTQWLYGPRGRHFPRTIVALARERGHLRVVDDQVGSPTTTLELAPALWDVLASGAAGVFHAACEGSVSWHGFAAEILQACGLSGVVLEPCASAEFPRPARRPAYSVLDASRLARLRGRTLAPWRRALADYLEVEPL